MLRVRLSVALVVSSAMCVVIASSATALATEPDDPDHSGQPAFDLPETGSESESTCADKPSPPTATLPPVPPTNTPPKATLRSWPASEPPRDEAAPFEAPPTESPPKTPTRSELPQPNLAPSYTGQTGTTHSVEEKERLGGWYGEQILYVDGGLLLLAMPTVGISLAGYFVGGPIVHIVHENYGAAAGSLGLRVGLPLVGFAGGVAAACAFEKGGYCALVGLVVGVPVGAIAATLIDAYVLAYHDPLSSAGMRPATGFRLLPDVRITDAGASLGLVGVF